MISPSRWLYRGSFVVALTAMLMISGAYTIGNEPEHVSLEESKIREAIEAALPLLEKSSNGRGNYFPANRKSNILFL